MLQTRQDDATQSPQIDGVAPGYLDPHEPSANIAARSMPAKRSQLARVGIFLSLLTLVPLLAPALGLRSADTVEHLRTAVSAAGGWGWLAFIAAFVLVTVLQIPAFAFVLAAPTLFHFPESWWLTFVASNLAVIVGFAVVRRFGGQPLTQFERPWLHKLFAQLEAHPVRTVALLRLATVMFPPVTSALALTQVRARDHALGTVLGLLLPITGLLWASDALLRLGR